MSNKNQMVPVLVIAGIVGLCIVALCSGRVPPGQDVTLSNAITAGMAIIGTMYIHPRGDTTVTSTDATPANASPPPNGSPSTPASRQVEVSG